MLRRLIGEDVAIRSELALDLWTLRADPTNIEQVIVNLAVNARDAMPQGGRLTIRTENIILDPLQSQGIPEARPGRFVRLSIEDTGVGMSAEVVQHLFEPFFTTKGVGKGIGLGLAAVYGIVQQHGGWINVYSAPGQGAIFRIYLPALPGAVERRTAEAIPLAKLRGNGERILLVEDERDVRAFASRALSRSNYVVLEAGRMAEALAIFAREKGEFDLVFSDVVLPDGSGLHLVDELLSRKPTLKVLLSSGYTDDKSRWAIIREKGFPFLQKPYSLIDLLRVVQAVIQQG